jgi:hypothetical protein
MLIKNKKRVKKGMKLDKLTYFGKLENGKLKINRKEKFLEELSQYEDCLRLEIRIERIKSKGTLQQHRYYRGVILPVFVDEWGNSREATHQYLKDECGIKEVFKKGDKSNTQTKSTADYSVNEWQEFLFNLNVFSGQEGIILPDYEMYINSL